MNKLLISLTIALALSFSCNKEQAEVKNYNQNKSISQDINLKLADNIKEDYILNPYNKSGYLIIKYSNLVYLVNNKRIIIPIFRGDKESIYAEKVRLYQINKGEINPFQSIDNFEISHFVVLSKRGEMKKTFHEFLSFYKSNILKNIDIEHPSDFGQENSEWFITYDFDYYGFPCYMEIQIIGSEKETMRYQSVYEIQPDEEVDHFFYSIVINGKSQYKQ